MATQTESVVTPERYQQGISWKQWMEQIDRNQDKFQQNYDDLVLDQADVDAIKALMAKPGGPAKCLAIGEPWCPDVFRGMPVMAKLAEAAGLDIKIFFRDLNLDIMNEFLNKGEFQSIPTFVFYTKDHQYLGHWIEKSQKTKDEGPLLQAITSKMRNPDISQEEREKYMAEYAAFQSGPVWGGWRQAQVKEIRALLEGAVK
ncbi:MAG TPA: thioredoxin family protein [Dehalococcoidia bacterium]|nr:thioredoxin family protein [Dehalococcoidia bacterium]